MFLRVLKSFSERRIKLKRVSQARNHLAKRMIRKLLRKKKRKIRLRRKRLNQAREPRRKIRMIQTVPRTYWKTSSFNPMANQTMKTGLSFCSWMRRYTGIWLRRALPKKSLTWTSWISIWPKIKLKWLPSLKISQVTCSNIELKLKLLMARKCILFFLKLKTSYTSLIWLNVRWVKFLTNSSQSNTLVNQVHRKIMQWWTFSLELFS